MESICPNLAHTVNAYELSGANVRQMRLDDADNYGYFDLHKRINAIIKKIPIYFTGCIAEAKKDFSNLLCAYRISSSLSNTRIL